MNPAQASRVHDLIRTWVPVFDDRVDATELRLRAAAVIISLATGPYRGQEPEWERDIISFARQKDWREVRVLQGRLCLKDLEKNGPPPP